jgi:V8-like Glu-specific endopeptidase
MKPPHSTTLRKLAPALAACLLSVLPPALGAAQTIDPAVADRSALLAQSGSVENLPAPVVLSPLTDAVSSFPVNFTGAPSFRLHFNVASKRQPAPAPGPEAGWSIEIVDSQDATQKLWSYSPEPGEPEQTDFWSGQIFRSKATVIVRRLPGVTLRVNYDRVVRFAPDSRDLTMVANKLADGQPSEIKGWGKAVAKLTVVRDDNQLSFNCTGFLIAPDLLMTNRHCSESGSEARSVSAQFDHDSPGDTPPPEAQVGVKELVLSSCDLDFTILRLKKAAPFFNGDDRKPLKLVTAAGPQLPQSLLVIQHPGGSTKKASLIGCTLLREKMSGNSSSSTDFGHGCDTNKSSSGSPVQIIGSSADQNGKVVGIHHLGFRIDDAGATAPEKINRAVKITLITEYIKNVSPALAKELHLTP